MLHINWPYCSFNHYNWDYLYFYNYILPPVYNKIPLNVYFYLLVAGALLVAICWQPRHVFSWMVWCASGGLIFILLFQIHWQQQYWAGQMRKFASQDYEARIRAQWPDENRFFDFVLSHAPSGTSCYAVSQTNPRYIRYALYPKIMVAAWGDSHSNCVFVFNMEHPLQYVPVDFGRVLWYDRHSLMAFKGD